MKTTLGRPLQIALRDAAKHPESWDLPGLLNDAADNLDETAVALKGIANIAHCAWLDKPTIRAAFEQIELTARVALGD